MANEMGFYKFNLRDKKLRARKKALLSEPVKHFDLPRVKNVADLLDAYKDGSIQARNLGMCADVFSRMLKDKGRPTVILGLAGPLIAAGLRKVIRDMIEYNLVDVIVSTGAILYQDYYQALATSTTRALPTPMILN